MAEDKKIFKRLSKAVQPSNYDIKIQPNLETFKFSGEETIDIEVCIKCIMVI